MRNIIMTFAIAAILLAFRTCSVVAHNSVHASNSPLVASIEKAGGEAGQKEPGKSEGKQVFIDRLGFKMTVPGEKWKAQLKDEDASPLELSHPGSGLIQLVCFQKTMATIPELTTSLNGAYEKKFSADGASEYAIKVNKDYKFKTLSGKRVLSTFKKGKETFVLDQVYLEGADRIFVLVLTISKAGYEAVKGDFEIMIKSIVLGGGDKQVTPP